MLYHLMYVPYVVLLFNGHSIFVVALFNENKVTQNNSPMDILLISLVRINAISITHDRDVGITIFIYLPHSVDLND